MKIQPGWLAEVPAEDLEADGRGARVAKDLKAASRTVNGSSHKNSSRSNALMAN